jgi:uncharacterized membrane protein YqjE
VLDSVRTLLASALGIAHARLELVGAELQQELSRLVALLVGSLAALFFAGLGVAFVAATVMIAAWDSHRLAAAISLAIVFLAAGAALGWRVQSRLGASTRMFDASLRELEQDRAALAASAGELVPVARTFERGIALGQWVAGALMLVQLVRRVFRGRGR